MVYCTAADVKVYVGSTVSDADLGYMIADADKKGDQRSARLRISVDTDTAKQASIFLVRSAVASRFHLTGENPTGFSSGDYSQSGSADTLGAAKYFEEQAWQIISDYAKSLQGAVEDDEASITRCDAVMSDFKLDQTDNPSFYVEGE